MIDNKLLKILDTHSVQYKIVGEEGRCFCYAFSDDFDVIRRNIDGKYSAYTPDGLEFKNIFHWLGY